MVEIIKIYDKNGEPMTTKEGVELIKRKFEVNDIFIPQTNRLISKKLTNGEVNTIKCIVKDFDDEEETYIQLTPSQANYFKNLIANGLAIHEHMFKTYSYEKDDNEYIGISLFENIQPKSFKDFE